MIILVILFFAAATTAVGGSDHLDHAPEDVEGKDQVRSDRPGLNGETGIRMSVASTLSGESVSGSGSPKDDALEGERTDCKLTPHKCSRFMQEVDRRTPTSYHYNDDTTATASTTNSTNSNVDYNGSEAVVGLEEGKFICVNATTPDGSKLVELCHIKPTRKILIKDPIWLLTRNPQMPILSLKTAKDCPCEYQSRSQHNSPKKIGKRTLYIFSKHPLNLKVRKMIAKSVFSRMDAAENNDILSSDVRAEHRGLPSQEQANDSPKKKCSCHAVIVNTLDDLSSLPDYELSVTPIQNSLQSEDVSSMSPATVTGIETVETPTPSKKSELPHPETIPSKVVDEQLTYEEEEDEDVPHISAAGRDPVLEDAPFETTNHLSEKKDQSLLSSAFKENWSAAKRDSEPESPSVKNYADENDYNRVFGLVSARVGSLQVGDARQLADLCTSFRDADVRGMGLRVRVQDDVVYENNGDRLKNLVEEAVSSALYKQFAPEFLPTEPNPLRSESTLGVSERSFNGNSLNIEASVEDPYRLMKRRSILLDDEAQMNSDARNRRLSKQQEPFVDTKSIPESELISRSTLAKALIYSAPELLDRARPASQAYIINRHKVNTDNPVKLEFRAFKRSGTKKQDVN